ncbi:hypothetical protein LTR62_002304 [Meristemomyces frigidus]|uniref:AMMECR1 domain-containing protein n=1 Tax=Meristemomyces frigidus TaxID=1508187 RepID=A0AAN7TJS4_9PEZI|nr:hypothetical protein LTR62_002304 [Meristemomyces frigidus]
MSLVEVEQSWDEYCRDNANDDEDAKAGGEAEEKDEVRPMGHPVTASAMSSGSSLPLSTNSTSSSISSSKQSSSGAATPASSSSSAPSTNIPRQRREYPLFITWNTVSRNGHKSLRGCIGTFKAVELEHGLRSYALTSAFEDDRFAPIPASLLPSLSSHVTLLNNFSQPTKDPMDWTIGKHGITISFTINGRRYNSTYLPDVAKEQGWTKEEALISLMRKAGWNGSSSSWARTWRDGKGELVRYEGAAVGLLYQEWAEWRTWVEQWSPA